MANKKVVTKTPVIPGMEEFTKDAEEEFFFEGVKKESYFDAAVLDDTPSRQTNANGSETYNLYVVFPSQDELVRAIRALTGGKRKSIAASAKIGTLNGVAVGKDGMTFLETWEQKMLGIEPKAAVPSEDDIDEAQAPI